MNKAKVIALVIVLALLWIGEGYMASQLSEIKSHLTKIDSQVSAISGAFQDQQEVNDAQVKFNQSVTNQLK